MSWLSLAEWWYNSHYHVGLQTSPFEALYGYKPPHLNLHQFGQISDPTVKQFCKDRAQFMHMLRHQLLTAQSRIKSYADKHRTKRSFEPGDRVYLKVRPYKQLTLKQSRYGKLAPKYCGPFLVEQKVGAVAYKLKLPEQARIHPTFHVSLLKKKLGSQCNSSPDLPPMDSEGFFLVEPVAILDRRLVKQNNAPNVEVLVQWANTLPTEATWENWDQLHQKFPQFCP